MPSGVSFIQLEGNYVISFRDMNEALPAFTAVKLDRRRGSWDGALGDLNGSLGGGSRRQSVSAGGSPRRQSPVGSLLNMADDGAGGRRRSSAVTTSYKLVLTGIPRSVRTELIRARLDPAIPGIERVYRDPEMARQISHPPVFVETRMAMAEDAFMLRADWVPVVQRIIKEANQPAASEDEGIGISATLESVAGGGGGREADHTSLVDTMVTCPHGRYNGQVNCLICRNARRRNTMLADDIVSHNLAASLPSLAVRPATPATPTTPAPLPAPAPRKPKSSCASCLACLLRFVPGRRKPKVDDDEADGPRTPVPTPAVKLRAVNPLVTKHLIDIKNRRMSAYDDVPAVSNVVGDFK